jgi:hypothetical protein
MGRMSEGQIPSGTVTAADLYGAVEATRREVGQILTKVEVMDDRYVRVVAEIADHETRLRAAVALIPSRLPERLISLERWQWRAGGVVAAFAVLGGLVAGLIEALIVHHP